MGDLKTKEMAASLSDSQLAVEMLKRKLISEAQLKAAIDYQESVGGGLLDVLTKLGLVREKVLKNLIRKLAGEEITSEAAGLGALDEVDPSRLKVHKKLLEKVPRESVERYELLFFFPPPGTRAILMSANQDLSEDEVGNLRSLLGVEIQPISLPAEARERFLSRTKQAASGTAQRDDATGEGSQERILLQSLINLLIRKKVVTAEELKVELEILRHK